MSIPILNSKVEVPTFERIYELLLNLARQISKTGFKPDIVVGLARGGWLPARVLSDWLRIPEIADVRTEFYLGVGENRGRPIITQPISSSVKYKKVLVVDDVVDTGKSLTLVNKYLKEEDADEHKTAVIYYKPWSILTPDWFEIKTSRWIIFPWEIRETLGLVLEKCKKNENYLRELKEKLAHYGLEPKLVAKLINEILDDKNDRKT